MVLEETVKWINVINLVIWKNGSLVTTSFFVQLMVALIQQGL